MLTFGTDRIILYGTVGGIHTAIIKPRDGVGRKQADVQACSQPQGMAEDGGVQQDGLV